MPEVQTLEVPKERLSREEKKAQTRQRLVDAAAEVFARRGYVVASVDEVAEEAGLTKGAVYSNFASKDELFQAVVDDHLGRRMDAIPGLVEGRGTPSQEAEAAGELLVAAYEEERTWFLLGLEFTAYAARNAGMQPEISARFRRDREETGEIIERQLAALGVDPPLPPDQIAVAFFALSNGFVLQKLGDPEGVPDDLLGKMLAIFFEGLVASARDAEDSRT